MALLKPNIAKMSKNGDIDGLIKAIQYQDKSIRNQAIIELGKIGNNKSIDPIIRTVEPIHEMHQLAINSFWSIVIDNNDEKMLEPLILALNSQNDTIIQISILGLEKINNHKAIDPIIDVLRRKSRICRVTAASALGSFKNKRVLTPLLEAIADTESVMFRAKESLEKLKDIWENSVFLRGLDSKDIETRMFSIDALGQLADPRVVQPIIQSIIQDPGQYVSSKEMYLEIDGTILAETLERIGSYSIGPLIGLLNNKDDRIRYFTVYTLQKIADNRTIESLISLLGDPNKNIKKCAIIALGNTKDIKCIPALLESIKNKDQEIRIIASRALCEVVDPRGIVQLEKEGLVDEARKMKFNVLSNFDKIWSDIKNELSNLEKKLAEGEIVHHDIELLYLRQSMFKELIRNIDITHNDVHFKLEEIITRLGKIENSSNIKVEGDYNLLKKEMRDSVSVDRRKPSE